MTGSTPPHRDMPDEVRDRLRRKLWRDLETPTGFRARTPIAVAAVVSLLIAATVLVARSPSSTSDTSMAGPDTEGPSTAELDRCYQAIQHERRTADVPARPEWTASFSTDVNGITVLAGRADGKPVFCESTLTTVTVSDPDATPAQAPGTQTGVLFATSNGTVAGSIDPRWESVLVSTPGGGITGQPLVSSGMFVTGVGRQLGPDTPMQIQQLRPGVSQPDSVFPMRDLPPVPAPLLSIVDRPIAGDRSSAAGQLLDQCMRDSVNPQPDRDSWSPAAAVTTPNGGEMILAVNGQGVAACERHLGAKPPRSAEFMAYLPYTYQPDIPEVSQYTVSDGQSTDLVLAGTVRADAAKMMITVADQVTLAPTVSNGTFAVVMSFDVRKFNGKGLASLRATLQDDGGNTLYEGPLKSA